MKTLILDGFNEWDGSQSRTITAVAAELEKRGWPFEILAPRDLTLAPCTGCFGCWTKRPGRCVQDDDADRLCRRIMLCDLMLIVSPITFGGYSSSFKGALDRLIGLISPFFTVVRGEVHHRPRYDRVPAMAALGINHGSCQVCPALFETLLFRNAVNFHPPTLAVEVAGTEETENLLRKKVANLLDKVGSSVFSDLPGRRVTQEDFAPEPGVRMTPEPGQRTEKRALLLSGSPRRRSTSSVIGEELSGYLREKGWKTELTRILPALRDGEKWRQVTQSLDEADLVVLLAPLYADSLPAPVTKTLESIADHRRKIIPGKAQGFSAVLNCGFPEAFHNYTALAIAGQFALEAGFTWLGGLALGMGGAINGNPLYQRGRMARNIRAALKITAAAMDRGEPVPSEAFDKMSRPFFPTWLYLAFGNWSWKRQARKNGIREKIHARPYGS